MSDNLLLAIDSGLTVTKAVVFDRHGTEVAVGERRITVHYPHPHHVERDMDEAWAATAAAIRDALAAPGVDAARVRGVGVTAHGDGLYPVTADLRPAGPGILSLDSRAVAVLERWQRVGVADEALTRTGQTPHVSAPATLLAWLAEERPECLARTRWVMACKDWIRLCLTGEVATDPTEASESFTDVETQDYSAEALRLFGLSALEPCLPPVVACDAPAGRVSTEVAAETGLPAGTPVATGLHDVTAAAIGLGNIHPGELTVVAGTYSINETISTHPARNPSVACRNGFRPGEWMNMAISPASSANIDWVLREFCQREQVEAEARGGSVFDTLQPEIERAAEDRAGVFFHPFLYGSPLSDRASGGLFGLKGWHTRGHVLLAVLEGIAYNHRTHVDALKAAFPLERARAAGGGVRNPVLRQRFADNFRLPVGTVSANEVSALGAAVCAGVAGGVYEGIDTGVAEAVHPAAPHEPDPQGAEAADEGYALYRQLAKALEPLWPKLSDREVRQ